MRTLILGIVFIATASGLSAGSPSEGPVFDRDGRLTSYLYADGTSDGYKYDSQSHMTSFIGRNGEVTTFQVWPGWFHDNGESGWLGQRKRGEIADRRLALLV